MLNNTGATKIQMQNKPAPTDINQEVTLNLTGNMDPLVILSKYGNIPIEAMRPIDRNGARDDANAVKNKPSVTYCPKSRQVDIPRLFNNVISSSLLGMR